MDITAYTNEEFIMPALDMTAWSVGYTLSSVTWRMQVKSAAASPVPLLDIPNYVGTVNFASNAVQFVAPQAAIAALSGSYVWDFGFYPAPGADFIRCDGGNATFIPGVTR